MKSIIKSPMNYIGGKGKLLPQLLPLFPDNIDTLHDVFAGGGNITANVISNNYIVNDINIYVIEIIKYFYNTDISVILDSINYYIDKFKLTKSNIDGYNECRKYYNSNKNPILLYTLVCYSFNYQFRFNTKHEYNNAFGKDRSCFSPTLKSKLISFITNIKDKSVLFYNYDFLNYFENIIVNQNDFVYCDPPYLITTGSYNDGKRGFSGWNEDHDILLYNILDNIHSNNIKFALSNVLHHKNMTNEILNKWSKKYNIHYINGNYNNSSYNSKNNSHTQEILITNY